MDTICSHVSNGGSLIELCQTWQLAYGKFATWIHTDITRSRRYKEALKARDEWSVERIILELRRLANFDIRKLFNEDGSLKAISEWPEDAARSVVAVEIEELFDGRGDDRTHIGYTKRIKAVDKIRSNELLGKTLRMFIDRHEVNGITLEELVGAASKPEPAKIEKKD